MENNITDPSNKKPDSAAETPVPSSNSSPQPPKPSAKPSASLGTKIAFRVTVAAGAIIVATAAVFLYRSYLPQGITNALQKEVREFSVADKISQSASIIINLPLGITAAEAKNLITFEPAIAGDWFDSSVKNAVSFKPVNKLAVGKYYTVTLAAKEGEYKKDFLADEDPKVIASFPKENSEADENSAITLVFNRPVAALTTLEELDQKEVPVEITPATEGKFKWISTRNLQFIPSTRLVRSAHYSVSLKAGMITVEGLELPAFSYSFTTRPLRYEANGLVQEPLIYDKPIRITFNQPIDLDRTKENIKLARWPENSPVEFTAEYGRRDVYDPKQKKNISLIERSILEIYDKADRFGRAKFWDFEKSYQISINKALPLEGGIELNENRTAILTVTRVISAISAESPRSKFASRDFYDPQGKLWVSFYEPVDKQSSVFESPLLKETGYGEKCIQPAPGTEVQYDDPSKCEKETDYSKLYFIFDAAKIDRGQKFDLVFKKIMNRNGLQLNPEPITETVRTFPPFQVIKSNPAKGTKGASLTSLSLCTTSPIVQPAKEDYNSLLSANLDAQIDWWSAPQRIESSYAGAPCSPGEFYTSISYKLVPESDYDMSLKLTDDFGQETSYKLSFATGKMPEYSLNFYHLQEHYTVTTPDKTRLTYAVENMDFVNVDFCRVSAVAMLGYLQNKPDYTLPSSALSCLETRQEKIGLQKKFWVKNYFNLDLKDYVGTGLGHWILTFSNPAYHDQYEPPRPVYERTYVTVTHLAAVEKRVERGAWGWKAGDDLSPSTLDQLKNVYWVTALGDLSPVAGARIDVYATKQDNSLALAKSGVTDQRGVAELATALNAKGIIVTSGDDSAIVIGSENKFSWVSDAERAERVYMYTDRPIYKPGDDVFLKGLYRVGYDGAYEIYKDKKITIEVFNAKNESIYKKESVPISDFGTFNDHFTIPADAPLGSWRVQALGGMAGFDVEEYVPAAFKTDIKTSKDEYIAGDTMELDVNANYYFGVPLEGGDVAWSLVSQDYYFDRYQDGYFSFGSPWYDCMNGCSYGDKFVMRGSLPLDQAGHAHISQALDFSKFFNADEGSKSKIFVAYVTVKNKNGQSVSAQQSFIVHRGEFYAGVSPSESFLGKNQSFTVRAKTVDTTGKPLSVSNAKLEINKITWKSFKRREVDGGYYYRWERVADNVSSDSFNTDSKGDWSKEYKLSSEGEYEIRITAEDSRKNPITGAYSVYVYGEGAASVQPANDTSFDIVSEKNDFNVGDTAKIIVKSPYDHAKALISVERGRVYSYEIVSIDQNMYEYSLPIKQEYLPNIYVSAVLISPKPEVKYGQLAFTINTDLAKLNVDVSTDKTYYLPGERVSMTVKTTDSAGRPVSSETSIAVADLSVLALKGNPKKNPLVFFYDGFPLTVSTGSNLKSILHEVDVSTLEGEKGGGGGGMEPDDLARKKRGVFKDTAFWQADVKTDDKGLAQISFTLPDNLTTWQTEALSISKDTRVGVGYKEFTSRKELMIVPLQPRFVIPGDEFMIGAKIFNQSSQNQLLAVKFESPSLVSADNKTSRTIAIDPGKSETIYFAVKAPAEVETGSHQFTLTAENAAHRDSVDGSFPITANDTYETVATAGSSNKDSVKEFVYLPNGIIAGKGGLEINESATLAVFLSDALKYLADYPYGCSEQIASKLSAIGILKRALSLKNVGDKMLLKPIQFEGKEYTIDEVVAAGLNMLYEAEVTAPAYGQFNSYNTYNTYGKPFGAPVSAQISGGFAYYKGLKADPYLTLHVLNTFADLKQAGYAIRSDVLDRAIAYINNLWVYPSAYYPGLTDGKDFTVITAYTISRFDGYGSQKTALNSKVSAILADKKFVNEDVSSETLGYLAVLTAKGSFGAKNKEQVSSVLQNRIEIDSRGAYVASNQHSILWSYYETPIKNTALALKAFAAAKSQNAVLDKVLRWIVRSRAKDGAWGSTQNTVAVIDAFADYLSWQKETESNFTLITSLDNSQKGSYDFSPQTILDQYALAIPVSEISLGKNHALTFTRQNRNQLQNNFYYDASLKYYLPADKIPARDEGFTVTRAFYALDDTENKTSLQEAKVGDVIKGRLTITVPKTRNFVMAEDYVPAGTEIVNFNLATEDASLQQNSDNGMPDYYGSPYGKSGGTGKFLASILGFGNDNDYYEPTPKSAELKLYPDRVESHNDRVFLFKQSLEPGVYVYEYYVRALIPGTYSHLPATASEMYFPENFGRTGAEIFKIKS